MANFHASGICGYCLKSDEQMVAFPGESKWMCSACLFNRVKEGIYDSRSAGDPTTPKCHACGESGAALYCSSCGECDRAHGCSSCGDEEEDVYCSDCGACEESHSSECIECYETAQYCSAHANKQCSECNNEVASSEVVCNGCRACQECDGDNGEGVVCRVCFEKPLTTIPFSEMSDDGTNYTIEGMEVNWS